MKLHSIILCFFLLFGTKKIAQNPIVIGEYFDFISQIYNENYQIQIALPKSYHIDKNKKYPVVYLLDSEVHFQYFTGITERLSSEKIKMIPEMIVVGIKNNQREKTFEDNGKLGLFFQDELLPFIKEHYRTDEYKILVGHSLSGFAALKILLNSNRLFDAYIVHEPSAGKGKKYLINDIHLYKNKKFDNQILVVTQADEKFNTNEDKKQLYKLIKTLKSDLETHQLPNLQWQYFQFEDETHGTVPLRANDFVLRKIFAK